MFLTKLFTDPIFFLQYIAIVVASIVMHELAHGL
jgi:hypothetical protein